MSRHWRSEKIRYMNWIFDTKQNHKQKFRDYEKRISRDFKFIMFFDHENKFHENLWYNLEMRQKKTDLMMIQKKHQITIIVIKNSSAKFKKIKKTTFLLIIALSIKIKTLNSSKRRQINVYAEKNKIIEFEHEMNVSIMRKSFVLNNYIFRSIHKRDLVIESYLIEINVVISDIWNSISMTNLKKTSIKIYKNQFFERFNLYWNQNSISSVSANFHHANVFFEKKISETKFEFNLNNVLFEKTVFENDFSESVNSFFIESVDSKNVLKFNVNNHWKEDFKKKFKKF